MRPDFWNVDAMPNSQPMGSEGARHDFERVILTREVRWFQSGPLPDAIVEWFTSNGGVDHELRVDYYDLASARSGVGRKHRNGTTLDIKIRVGSSSGVHLAEGLDGDLEDWLKLVEHRSDASTHHLIEPVQVSKWIRTRRFDLDTDVGCEVELAEVEVDAAFSWSLCLETFGDPTRRAAALSHGVDRFLTETPLPDGITFGFDACASYPDWFGRLGSLIA